MIHRRCSDWNLSHDDRDLCWDQYEPVSAHMAHMDPRRPARAHEESEIRLEMWIFAVCLHSVHFIFLLCCIHN